MRGKRDDKGLVVIFALVLMGAVAMIATAFAILVRTEKKAARNSCLAAQAELAALSGLERAVAVTERALTLAASNYAISPDGVLAPDGTPISSPLDPDSGWHRYFEEDDLLKGVLLSDAEKWVWHYKDQHYAPEHLPPTTHDMRGRTFPADPLPPLVVKIGVAWYDDADPPNLHEMRYASRYAVCVVDLDGKLHSLPAQWGLDGVPQTGLEAIIATWAQQDPDSPLFDDLTEGEKADIVGLDTDTPCCSVREIASRAVTDRSDLDAWRKKTCAVEAYMTPYPVGGGRSQLNVNTARTETIEAAISQIPSLIDREVVEGGHIPLVTKYLCSRRPYASRAEFEDALFLATAEEDGKGFVPLNWPEGPAEADEEYLTEKEFNDILNSTAGVPPQLTVELSPDTVTESGGVLTGAGTVKVSSVVENPLPIALMSSNTSEAVVVAMVTVPALGDSVSFDIDITAAADLDSDGDKTVTISASAVGYQPGSRKLHVLDDDIAESLSVSITPASATEGAAPFVLPGAGMVSRSGAVTGDFLVSLSSTDGTEAVVPKTVTITDGSASAMFNVTVLPDGLEDGDQTLSTIASASGYNSGFVGFTVEDNGASYAEPDESIYDDPNEEGQYSFDGWEPYADGEAPSQTGGDCTVSDRDVTWGCEFKFTSRYFHIYSVGLVREMGTGKVLARRKLHAVYDAEDDRVLWFRWNVTERGNIGDFSP